MNPQFVAMVPQVVACNLKLYLHLIVFLMMGKCMQCLYNYPHLRYSEKGDVGELFTPGCYSYWQDSAVEPLIRNNMFPDHAACRMGCGRQPGANVAGLTNGRTCSCFSREEFHFETNAQSEFMCHYTCGSRIYQRCGGYRTASLMTPIYPELPNCFHGILEPANNATLGRAAYVGDGLNTNQKCREACSRMEYPFAAVWGMFNCWCLPSPFGLALVPSQLCNLPCLANPSEKCGGYNYAWVMKSAPVVDVTCLQDQRGLNYRGKVAVTGQFQQPCTPWSLRMEKLKEYINPLFRPHPFYANWIDGYDKMRPEERNSTYCRNIDNDERGPWCFANIKYHGTLKRHCYIPLCPSEVITSTTRELCAEEPLGRDYLGSKATTHRGERCMSWSHPDVVRKLHATFIGEYRFNHLPIQVQRSNLCRNIGARPNGPWCYIDGRFPAWDYCGIEICNKTEYPGCKVDAKGLHYTGDVHYAKTGQQCRVWASLDVQRHMATSERLITSYRRWPRDVKLSNPCRNPDNWERGPWCYIEGEDVPSRRVCDIRICNQSDLGCKVDVKGLDYNGYVHYTRTGQPCRTWGSMEVKRHLFKSRRTIESYMKWPRAVQLSNYCRNPDHYEGGPWCYVEGEDLPSWSTCDIKICNDTDHTLAVGAVAHADNVKPNTQMSLHILVGTVVYWKLRYV